jgi:two-component system chemotaxis sensor kinase CheA
LRDAVLPVLELQTLFEMLPRPGADECRALVAVEADAGQAALEVDELLGQRQVVAKSRLAGCSRVPQVSAATVLGDGRVAPVLDIGSLARLTRCDCNNP